MANRILIILLLFICTALLSCKSADEQDALYQAQKCLDDIPVGSYAEADNCMQFIKKYDSQQAKIIKCSIKMVSGGLMEDKVLKAYQISKDDTVVNKEAAYMAVLALTYSTIDDGLTKAQAANVYCQSTGVPGLMYLANIIVAGTAMAKIVENFGTTITVDTSPTAINAAVQAMLSDCTGATPDATKCTDDNLNLMGTAVATLSVQYCANENAEGEVCDKVKEATATAGSNTLHLGQALLCYMNNKTFNPSTGLCN